MHAVSGNRIWAKNTAALQTLDHTHARFIHRVPLISLMLGHVDVKPHTIRYSIAASLQSFIRKRQRGVKTKGAGDALAPITGANALDEANVL